MNKSSHEEHVLAFVDVYEHNPACWNVVINRKLTLAIR